MFSQIERMQNGNSLYAREPIHRITIRILLTEVCAVLALCIPHVENFKGKELVHRTLAVLQGAHRFWYTINCSED